MIVYSQLKLFCARIGAGMARRAHAVRYAAAFGILFALVAAGFVLAAPVNFIPLGPGGGGAFFGPSVNPYNPDDLWIGSDMSDLFHSTDFGRTWDTVDFRVLGGGSQPGRMEFTADSRVRYALNGSVPARSLDSGATWTSIPPDPYSQSVYCLYADPSSTNRLIVSDYSTLKISLDCGATYRDCFTSNDLLIAGAFWDGQNIYVGTRAGLVASTDGGSSFHLANTPGIPGTEAMVSFTGAKEGGTLRFFCITLGSGDVYPGVQGSDYGNYHAIYRLDGGAGSWTPVVNGVASTLPFFVAMCRTNISIAYAGGSDGLGQPVVLKTVNGGALWSQVMQCSGNANVATGWTGDDSGGWNWKKWSFGECAMGFTVCQSDPGRVVISDYGFMHVTTNGGASWRQAYDWQGCENPAGSMTPKTNFYTGCGAEDTSSWWLSWFSSNVMFCSFTDMRGMLSTNGGKSWMSPMSLALNSTYQTVAHPNNGIVYAAESSVHDMYAWDRYCQDSSIDGGSGAILYSTNAGATWATLKNLGRPIVALALDPNNPNRLYASMVNSASGGVYRTTNLNAGTSATWSKLAVPPRAMGHPYNIRVLNDGTIVATYSARIVSNDFQKSSGVFVSTNDGASWLDRSSASLQCYTKDITIDPYDPAQNTWYASVWGEWGSSSGLGGLYLTTTRGVSWNRITANLRSVCSCSISPVNSNEMYVTTEDQGLWYSTNRMAASPTFTAIAGYPFQFPTRVFFNPYDTNEVWVTSFGNGMRLGRIVEPRPQFSGIDGTNTVAYLTVKAAHGQKIVLDASTNILSASWQPIATNVMFTDSFIFGDACSDAIRYFRATVR
jgi:hypothetical protein